MKKAFKILYVIFICSTANAQTEKGHFFTGISTTLSSVGTGPEMFGVGFSSSQTIVGGEGNEPVKSYSVNLVPRIGYFIADNIALGLDVNLSYSLIKNESSGESQSYLFGGLGCFGRIYFPLTKVYPFVELNAGLGNALLNEKITSYFYQESNESESFFYNLGGGLGLAFPLGKSFTFDIIAGYDYLHETSDEEYFGLNIESNKHSLGLELGIILMLGSN